MSAAKQIQSLSLCHYQSCPFCMVTRKAIDNSNLEVELRDIQRQSEHRSELIKQGGRPQVPCLRIETANGKTHWLYESSAIIQLVRQLNEVSTAQSA